MEQLLPTLLNLEKLKEQRMGKQTLTHLHNSLVKCIENCESSLVYATLFDLLRRYKDQKIQLKLPDLILNCLTLLNRIQEQKKGKLNPTEILKSVNWYLSTVNRENKQKSDDMGIKAAKDVLKLIAKVQNMSVKDLKLLLVRNGLLNHLDGEYLLPNIRSDSLGSIEKKSPASSKPKPMITVSALKALKQPQEETKRELSCK